MGIPATLAATQWIGNCSRSLRQRGAPGAGSRRRQVAELEKIVAAVGDRLLGIEELETRRNRTPHSATGDASEFCHRRRQPPTARRMTRIGDSPAANVVPRCSGRAAAPVR